MFFKKNNTKQKYSTKSKELKKLKKRIKELELSRNIWKNKYKKVKEAYSDLKKNH